MDMQAITDKYYELTRAICDAEVTVVGEDGVTEASICACV